MESSITDKYGTKYFLDGELHRLGGLPASSSNLEKDDEYYEYGYRHRSCGLPAIENCFGKEFWVRGVRHNLYGPAIESEDIATFFGSRTNHIIKEWWIHGVQYTEKEFNFIVKRKMRLSRRVLWLWYDNTYRNTEGEAFRARMKRDIEELEHDIGYILY